MLKLYHHCPGGFRFDMDYNPLMQTDPWWREGVIYQIYPRSFADSRGGGLGDLPGITSRLDYLADLGVSAIWLSPFYPTPDKDFGYDISSYTEVDPRFGTLEDFQRLVDEAHARGLRVIIDQVLNHTSDQHPWFLESRRSREDPKSGWYLWSDSIPNNWQSIFGGPAWTWSLERRQYYFHMFLREQPDLNWRDPEVRQAILDVLRFWLERGVDGFRLDVFNAYFKDEALRSNPFRPGLRAFDRQRHVHDMDDPAMIPLLQEFRRLLDSFPDRYAVGETFLSGPGKIARYVGPDRLHAAFDFGLTHSPFHPASLLRHLQATYALEREHGIWPTHVLGNHDVRRPASRHGVGEGDERVKLMMALLLTQRGTPFLYYGDEIGMRDLRLRRDQILDPPGRKYWPFYTGRDGCRAPMQWDASPYAGFSSSKPWLPVHPDYVHRNVETQRLDPRSLFNFTRALLRLRREHPALRRGDFISLDDHPGDSLLYLRPDPAGSILVALNFRNREIEVRLPPAIADCVWEPLLTSSREGQPAVRSGRLTLQPYEARLSWSAQA